VKMIAGSIRPPPLLRREGTRACGTWIGLLRRAFGDRLLWVSGTIDKPILPGKTRIIWDAAPI